MQNRWNIGLATWIIQDGNYKDFSKGQAAKFAVEFHLENFAVVSGKEKSALHLGGSRYQVVAEVVFKADNVWVLNICGLLAFSESSPAAHVQIGDLVEGAVYLGIDPFFYFEYLNETPGIPALLYSWEVVRIEEETAPWLCEQKPGGPKVLTPDQSKVVRTDVAATDAWQREDKSVFYVLDAALLPTEPTKTRS